MKYLTLLLGGLFFAAATGGQEGSSPAAACSGTAQAEHTLKLCRDQRQGLLLEHVQEWTRYQDVLRQAGEHVADFRRTMRACGTWNETLQALGFLLGGFDGPAVASPDAGAIAKARQDLQILKDTVARLTKREKGELVIGPAELDLELQRFDVACENLGTVLDGMEEESADEMAEQAERCGAQVRPENFEGAQSYLETLRSALQMVAGIEQRVDGLRDKERDCLQKQFEVYQACVENARCQGTPESACAARKPAGDWPPIPPSAPPPAPATPKPPGSLY